VRLLTQATAPTSAAISTIAPASAGTSRDRRRGTGSSTRGVRADATAPGRSVPAWPWTPPSTRRAAAPASEGPVPSRGASIVSPCCGADACPTRASTTVTLSVPPAELAAATSSRAASRSEPADSSTVAMVASGT
jgi:hypothetical protein